MSKLRGTVATLAAVVLLVPSLVAAQKTPATNSLTKCQKTAGKEGAKLAKEMEKQLGGCLQAVANEVVKEGLEGDAAAAASKCAKGFRKLNDSRGLGKSGVEKFRDKLGAKCDPAENDHALGDLLGVAPAVDEPLEVANLDAWCTGFGGDGTVDDLDEWLDCLIGVHRCRTAQAMAARYPRILEWLDGVATDIGALPPPGGDASFVPDAVAAVDDFVTVLDANGDQALDPTCDPGVLCAPGFFSLDGKTPCAPCPEGTFSDTAGAATCTPCAVGRFAAATGKTTCSGCSAGSFQDAVGQVGCDPCPAGSFTSLTEAQACDPCPVGRFAASPGATVCALCAPGFFSGSGQTACAGCAPGTFSSITGSSTCDDCSAGRFSSVSGATTCLNCTPGGFSEPGASDCTLCPEGTFTATSESVGCTECPVGTFQAAAGQTSCQNCAAETYNPGTGQTECFPCAGAPGGASACSCTSGP
jgi:hypothetical protein